VLKKELNWKNWRPDCDEKPEIKRRLLSPSAIAELILPFRTL